VIESAITAFAFIGFVSYRAVTRMATSSYCGERLIEDRDACALVEADRDLCRVE
jgi:hypothetical protein